MAEGTLKTNNGQAIKGARVVAFAVEKDEATGNEEWKPIVVSETDRKGKFKLQGRPQPFLENASVDPGGEITLAVVANTRGSENMSMYQFTVDAEAAANGEWDRGFDDAADAVEDPTPARVERPVNQQTGGLLAAMSSEDLLATEGVDINEANGAVLKPSRSVGLNADGGTQIEMIMGPDTGPEQDGDGGLLVAQHGVPSDYCSDTFWGEPWQWTFSWRAQNNKDRAWITSGFNRTRTAEASWELVDKTKTEMQIALQFGTKIKGSMGYTKEWTNTWGATFNTPPWRRYDLRLEVEYRDYRLYCVNNYGGEVKWTNYVKWQPYKWTGGTQKYLTNRDFGCRYWRTQHQADQWVTRNETVYFSSGMSGLKGLSWSTKQRTDSSHKLSYKKSSGKYYLCGNDNHAIYADRAKEVTSTGAG